jgi:hypothetical protein
MHPVQRSTSEAREQRRRRARARFRAAGYGSGFSSAEAENPDEIEGGRRSWIVLFQAIICRKKSATDAGSNVSENFPTPTAASRSKAALAARSGFCAREILSTRLMATASWRSVGPRRDQPKHQDFRDRQRRAAGFAKRYRG